MENFSIKSYSEQLRLYSRSADPPKTKAADPASESSTSTLSNSGSKTSDLQSKDGDSVSLSLEARAASLSRIQPDDGALPTSMVDPEDVAAKVLQQLQQEHSEKGGSLQAFVEGIQNKLENRKEAGNQNIHGSNDFRLQVDFLIKSGLKAWSQSGGQTLNIQA